MAEFGFSEAQEMFRRSVRDFAQSELAPGAKQRAKSLLMPRDLLARMGQLGFVGISLPEKYGGQDGDWVTTGIAVEEITKVDFSVAPGPLMAGLAQLTLEQTSEEVKEEWLPLIARGEKLCCFAITEPDAGSDAAAIKTTAVRDGDYYVLNGEKSPISGSMNADAAILFAKTDPKAGAKGVTCFWVPLDLPGITRTPIPHTGWKPAGVTSILLESARIPAKYRVGEEGKGFYIFAGGAGADYLRVFLGLMVIAMAEASLEETMAYVQQRHAFGHPVSHFEGVAFKIAEHSTYVTAARLLCYRTLYLKDQGISHTKESAMCKWLCPQVAFDAIHDCILLHGHIGYSEEYPLEQRLRDALGFEFADGTAQIMKIVVARELMGKEVVPY